MSESKAPRTDDALQEPDEAIRCAGLALLARALETELADALAAKSLAEAQLSREVVGDAPCHDADGCPTENAVLRREWRRLTVDLAAALAAKERAEAERDQAVKQMEAGWIRICQTPIEDVTKERDALAAKLAAAGRDAAIGRLVREKLTSGNSIPVERCMVSAREVAQRLNERDALAAKLAAAELERDAIVELNHGQFLELEYLRRIHAAADQLYSESEEYDFDDGMGRGAPQQYWDAMADAFEPETEAIKEEVDAARGVKS